MRIGWRRQTKPKLPRPKASAKPTRRSCITSFWNGAGDSIAERSTHDVKPVRRRIELFRLAAGNDHGPAHIYAVLAFTGVRLEGESHALAQHQVARTEFDPHAPPTPFQLSRHLVTIKAHPAT